MKLKNRKKQSYLFVLMGILAFLTLQTQLHAYLMANFSECAFDPNCQKGGGGGINSVSQDAVMIESLVIQGAGYYLKGNSDILLFANKFELAGLNGMNYDEAREILDSAIENMEQGKNVYTNLINTANSTPYNEVFTQKLMTFNYSEFQQANGLYGEIFAEVKGFLSIGDVRGFYVGLQSKVNIILKWLYQVKGSIDQGIFPPVSDIWNLTQACAGAHMFGQYAAAVFYNAQ